MIKNVCPCILVLTQEHWGNYQAVYSYQTQSSLKTVSERIFVLKTLISVREVGIVQGNALCNALTSASLGVYARLIRPAGLLIADTPTPRRG